MLAATFSYGIVDSRLLCAGVGRLGSAGIRLIKRLMHLGTTLKPPGGGRCQSKSGDGPSAQTLPRLGALGKVRSADNLGVYLLVTTQTCAPRQLNSKYPSISGTSGCLPRNAKKFRSPFLVRPDFCESVKGANAPETLDELPSSPQTSFLKTLHLARVYFC